MLAPWEKSCDQPRQHIKKQRYYFATKVHLVKSMVFPVVVYGCESWTLKKAKHWRIDAFELWCWKRLLRVLWTARRSNQSILKEIKSWIFTGRTNAEAEAPILWPSDMKRWLIRKDLNAWTPLSNWTELNWLLWQTKREIVGFCLKKLCVPTWEYLMKGFITKIQMWGH